MRKAICVLLCIAMLAGSMILSLSADGFAYGDANGDGSVNLLDVTAILKACAGWDKSSFDYVPEAADVKPDGKVNLLDAVYLLKHIAGWEECAYLPEGSGPNILRLYVAADGDDSHDGSKTSPFATIDGAKNAIRRVDKALYDGITVCVCAGEYSVGRIDFTSDDSGTETCPIIYRARGNGEVVLNGGVTVTPDNFKKVTDSAVLSRLSGDARDKVLFADLTSLGVTSDDWGNMHAFGAYNTASGDYAGSLNFEVFENDARMTLARYPDSGYLKTGDVISQGTANGGDVYTADDGLCARISSWATLDDVWMYGYWKYDWADGSTPIGWFDAEKKQLSPKFASYWAAKKDAPYYFYNVFEELDSPGEWYLDRGNGLLYIYPTGDIANAKIELSLSTATMIAAQGVNCLTFDGFTFKGTRGDAIYISGNNNTVKNCLIKNIAGNAIKVYGYDNLIESNEITRTGCAGIYVDGGNTATLTPGNNLVYNNYVHDWSEIYQTYQAAISLNGVGNTASHNEMDNSPHQAITYTGNNHVIEYNKISRVCLLSSDAGAIYAGRNWTWYGNIIRYNLIENIGSGSFTPVGIYWDDALSGQTAYGNILIDVPGYSFQLGGGRDLSVYNNIIINDTRAEIVPISYDDRAIAGITDGGWYTGANPGGILWIYLEMSSWKSDVWREAYPQIALFSDDFTNTDDPNFIPNPSYSSVEGNLIIANTSSLNPDGEYARTARIFGDIGNNTVLSPRGYSLRNIFVSPEEGDFRIKEDSSVWNELYGFENLPDVRIGREK